MHFALGILMVSATLCGATLPEPKPVSKKLEALQGTWKVTSQESDGVSTPQAALDTRKLKVVIKDDTMTVSFGNGEAHEYLIEVDTGKTPHVIDVYTTKLIGIGRENGREVRSEFTGKYLERMGIYAVEGKTLKICTVPWTGMEERPTKFVTKGKPEYELFILTRQE
jgi:uncharacterized protein (TIGR03067 family)